MSDADSLALYCAGHPVGRYVLRPTADPRLSPRPCLHPVTTLGGTTVSELMPADHRHHLGVGVALPDVAGHNFWGGRTFVRGRGPTDLDNHGVQRHQAFTRTGPEGFAEDLSWRAGSGELLRERRTVTAVGLTDRAWALDLAFSLTNTGGDEVSLGSPATNGRSGAAYGGFFWRAPKEPVAPLVFTADATGEEAVHGTRADWLALAGGTWTLVFAAAGQARRDPWFVRAAEYPGVGSSLASRTRLPLAPGASTVRRIVTVVADGRLDRDAAGALAAKAVTA